MWRRLPKLPITNTQKKSQKTKQKLYLTSVYKRIYLKDLRIED